MNKRDHLRRLDREYYQADAIVHWSIAMLDRREGWLTATFLYRFRELMTHTMFRYGLACPIFCLMPDHIHMVWMGLCNGSDQLNAMKHFRPRSPRFQTVIWRSCCLSLSGVIMARWRVARMQNPSQNL